MTVVLLLLIAVVSYALGSVSALGGALGSAKGFANAAGYGVQTGIEQQMRNESNKSEALGNLLEAFGSDAYKGVAGVEQKAAQEQEDRELQTAVHWGDDFNQRLAERTQNIGRAGRIINDVARGVGGMAPSIAANAVVPGTSLPVLFTYAAGNATEEALNDGADKDAAILYGTAVGAVEVFTEKMFGGIPGMGSGGLDEAVESAIKSAVRHPGAQVAISALVDAMGEGFEEFVSEFADKALNDALVGSDVRTWDETAQDALYSALIGGLTGAVMNIGPSALRGMSETQAANAIGKQMQPALDELISIARAQGGNAAKNANAISARQTAGENVKNWEVGQLYRAISLSVDGETVGASNSQTVSSARENGVSERDAAMARRLSEITGRNIVFYSAAAENRGGRSYTENGYYDGEGTLHINAQSANPTAQIISHELTHALEGTEGYQAFRDAVLNRMTQSGQDVAQLRQQTAEMYQRAGRPASDVDSELVAQYVEKSLLTDEAAIRDICVSQPTAAQRILNWLDGILAKMGNQKAQERAAERQFLETARSFYQRGLAEVNAAGNVRKQTSTENVNIPWKESAPTAENVASERTSAQDAAQNTAEEASGDSTVVQNTAERTAGEDTAAEQADGDYFADLVEDGYDAAQEQAQQRTAQETQQETEEERRKRESYKDVPGLRWKSVAPARVDELLRTGLAELDGQQGVGNDGEVADAWQYSISENYESEYDRWIADGKKSQKPLYVGTTSEALKSIGARDAKIYWNTTKINSIQKNHPFMTDGVMKQVPQILENPILIMESKTQPNRVTMYGEVYAENGIPVMAVLELAPRSNKGYELQNMVIANAYNKGADVKNASIDATQRLIDSSDILYVDPDKKRTDNWLSLNRLQLPLGITSYGPIHNITLVARDSQGNFSADTKNSDLPEWKKNLQEYSEQQFSVSEDSQGRKLSEAQQAYFRDSAVRDEDGRLMVMYHGTRAENGDFTVFDYSKAVKKGGLGLKALGKGNYFTSKQLDGTERFGSRVIEAYLNITNPFVYDGSSGDTVSLAEQVQKKTGTDTQGMSYDALQDAMRDLGYDGVVEYRRDGSLGIAVTFDSDQIKNVTNQNPTGDPDIRYSVSEDGKTQDELLDFVTQFQKVTEERFREVPKESTKETVEDNAEAIRGDLEQLAELARQSAEAQGVKRQTPEEIAESKVNARVGEEKPGFMDRLRHPGQTIRDAGESLRQTGENLRDTGRFFYRKLVDSGEAVSRVGKQSGDRHLYAYYNKARASTNAAISMIENAATDINGRVTGKSLNAVLDPIRAKGDDYYNRFQLYLFHLHNVDRMSIANFQVEEAIRDGLSQFRLENPELNQYTDAEIREFARDESNELCPQARDYLELQRALDKAAAQNKPVFGAVTAYESEALAERLKQEHPEFEELAKDVYKYIDNLLQYCVDTGLIRPGDKDNLQRKYPHYVPTYRVIENQSSAPRGRQNVQKIGDAIGRAKGSDLPLMPLHKQLAQKTFSTVREGSKNLFAQRLLDMHNDDIRSVFRWRGEQVENGEKKSPNGWNIIVRDRGLEYQMNVSPAMYEAFKALSPDSAETARFLKGMRSANDLFKRLCTSDNPTFLVRNFFRDLQDAGINTKNGAAFAKAYPKAWKEMKNGGEYWQAYQALGGTYSSFFDYQKSESKRAATKVGKAKEKFNLLNEAVEQAPRFAEFIATIDRAGGLDKAGTDVMMDAIYNAAEVTTNFGRSGEWSRFLNRYLVPFFNPSVQGADKMIRNITETKGFKPWASLVVRAAIFGFGGELLAKILNSVLHKDDKEWDLIRQSDKDLYYLFKIKDGLWLRIPKGRVTSVIGMIGSRVGNAVQGKDIDWAETFSTAASQVAPTSPFEANIFKNFTDAKLFDKTDPGTTWYGGDIESQRLQNLKPEERYDAGTDVISKWIGKETGLSPKKINYLLDQYSGVVGDIFLPLLSERPWEGIFRKSFTLNTTRSNRLSGEFYDRADELLWAKDDSGADAVVNRWWNHVSGDVSDINKAIREIESDSGKKDTEKNELLTVQYGLRNVAMQNALETEEEYRAAAEEAYEAAILGTEDDKISEAYREANRAVFGAEYALKVYNSQVYEKAAEAVKKGSTWDAYYDSYFGAKEYEGWFKYLSAAKQPFNDKIKLGTLSEMMDDDTYEKLEEATKEGISVYNYVQYRYDISNLKSDKDKDGNVIPGSKKEKIVEVIDGLNLTSEQKDFLYLQQRYSEDGLRDTPWHKRK